MSIPRLFSSDLSFSACLEKLKIMPRKKTFKIFIYVTQKVVVRSDGQREIKPLDKVDEF